MYFHVSKSNEKLLVNTYNNLTHEERKKISKHLSKIDFSKKTSTDILRLFGKAFNNNKIKFASYLYDFITKNKIVDKAYTNCQIKSKDKLPDDILVRYENGNMKKVIGYTDWFSKKKYNLITDWSKIKRFQKLCSIYRKKPLYFFGINSKGIYVSEDKNKEPYIISSIDFWLEIKD